LSKEQTESCVCILFFFLALSQLSSAMDFEHGVAAEIVSLENGATKKKSSSSLPKIKSFKSFRSFRGTKDDSSKLETVPSKGESSAGFFSKLVFWWVNPMVSLGYQQPLMQENLWSVKKRSECSTLFQSFEKQWAVEMQKPQQQRSLWKALFRIFFWDLVWSGILNACQNFTLLLTPLLIRAFLLWLENDDAPIWQGYAIGAIMFLVGNCLNGLLSTHMIIILQVIGMDTRTVLNASIYRKSLRLSNSARQNTSTGEVVTLMSNDAEKLPQSVISLHNLWLTPIFLIVAITMLVQLVGYGALAGVALLVLSIPFQGKMAFEAMTIQGEQMKTTEQRVKLLNEVLQGIKIVKFYAWEASFQEKISALRNVELGHIKKIAIINAKILAVLVATPWLMVLITLWVFFATGGDFKPDVVFTAVSLLYVIRFPMFFLPMAIAGAASAHVSLKRMQRYLEMDEISKEDREWGNPDGTGKGHGDIELNDASFMWKLEETEEDMPPVESKKGGKKSKKSVVKAEERKEENQEAAEESKEQVKEKAEPFTVEVSSLKLSGPELVAVVGMVGSGKSSLVSALLGEMTKTQGKVRVNGSVAYVAQTPWILNASVKQNILMGKAYEKEKYEKVLDVCALLQDLEMLPGGDGTEIGEKGINLSGGQKQRISLARAAYADADIYVFDDPLSAVDAHVGRHIFEKLMLEMLSSKTRVVCTNQLHFLPQMGRVLVLKQGKITESGTYRELMSNKGEFSVLMNTFEGEEDEESKEDPEKQENDKDTEEKKANVKEGASDLIAAEEKNTGSVKWLVFKTYLVDGTGGWTIPFLLLVISIVYQGTANVYEWWLSYWTEAYLEEPDEVESNQDFYIFIYFGLAMAVAFFVYIRGLAFAFQAVISSRHLHKLLTAGIIRAPQSFFDTTPVGRILNRFSKDMDNIDLVLPRTFPLFLLVLIGLLGILITMVLVLPWFAVPMLPIMFVYYNLQKHFRPVARDCQRLESISRSPIFAQFSETLAGISTLRAFNIQDAFIAQNAERIDISNSPFYIMHCCNQWLQLRLELLGGSINLACVFLMAASKSTSLISMNAGIAGLVLGYSTQITGTLNVLVQIACETETRITSAERIKEYSDLEHEAAEVIEGQQPPAQWPAKGEIVLKDLSMRYREGLPLVLQKVSLHINGGEKIGIAGRTGSGKSSLMIALFRLVEPAEGTILIDGLDFRKMGLKDLRSALSIIPQDPVMFCGSLRDNLDPFHAYEDKVVWDALRSAHLYDFVSANENKLDMEVSEGGENLSLGQRQLVCLARAILRRNKILVMDEATANIDMETDALIQETIKDEFKDCTVLTIAHRLHTIMECDKILIMEAGKVGEFDHAAKLLEKQDSLLSGLVEETGLKTAKKLKEIANSTFKGKALSNTEETKERGPES